MSFLMASGSKGRDLQGFQAETILYRQDYKDHHSEHLFDCPKLFSPRNSAPLLTPEIYLNYCQQIAPAVGNCLKLDQSHP